MTLWRRLRHLITRPAFERELDEELGFHLEQLTEDFVRSGLSPQDAARAARRRLGNRTLIAETSREQWLSRFWHTLVQDARYGLRQLRRNPSFTAVAVAILALGIGANSAIFSVLDRALLRPLPYLEPDRLVTLQILGGENGRTPFPWSYPKFAMMRENTALLEGVAAFSEASMNLAGGGDPERVRVEFVSGSYFGVLGARAFVGQSITPVHDTPEGAATIVLSHDLWVRRFGADPAVVGRTVTLKGHAMEVAGVMPAGFRSLSGAVDAWVPIAIGPVIEYEELLTEAGNHWLAAIGRLKPGADLDRTRAELAVIGRRVNEAYRFQGESADWSATAEPLAANRVDPEARQSLIVIGIAVGLVLLVACANLASLLLVRATARRREIAVRLTIGAGRGRLVAQLATESMLLAVLGGAVGIGVAALAVPVLGRLSPPAASGPAGLSYLFDPATAGVDARVLLFAAGLTLVTGFLVGVSPALLGSRADLRTMLASGGAPESGTSRWRRIGAYRILAAGEIALSLVLLVGAGLAIRSFGELIAIDTGFDGRNVLTFRLSPSETDLAGRDPTAFKAALASRLEAIPGVEHVGFDLCPPLAGPCQGSVAVRWRPEHTGAAPTARVGIGVHYLTPGYLQTLGVRLLRGRNFTDGDRRGTARVVLVNETAARRLWPDENPIGQRLGVASGYFAGGDSTAEVIGVIGDVRFGRREDPVGPDVFAPALQYSFGLTTVFVRTSGSPTAVLPAVRAALREVDPGLPLYGVATMDEVTGQATAGARFGAVILAIFAAAAMLLAVVGLYGVMAYSVAQRTREMGIRMALGARQRSVLGMVVRDGAAIATAGVAIGLAGTVLFGRVLEATLHGISTTDPEILGGVAAALLGAALAASYLPARRATRVDPVRALRGE